MANRGRPPLNSGGSPPARLHIRLPDDLMARLVYACAGRKTRPPTYIREILARELPPAPPINLTELEAYSLTHPAPSVPFGEDDSDHEDPTP